MGPRRPRSGVAAAAGADGRDGGTLDPGVKSRIDLARCPDFDLGALRVRPSSREVLVGGRREPLEPRVMQLLVLMGGNPGQVISRDELIDRCWEGRIVSEDSINRAISKLRRLSEQDSGASFTIETISRVGYRLWTPETGAEAPPEGSPPILAGVPDEPPAEPAAEPARRRRAVRPAALAAGVAALAGLLLAAWFLFADRVVSVTAGQPSLVVLPFADLSPRRDHAYFAEGVAEEILNVLAAETSLKVVGRTSASQFRDRAADMKAIRESLGVSHVLEGSVRSDAGQVRITVRLLRTSDGGQVWSQDYDRRLENIFALQDEIGASVAERLRGSLAGSAVRRATPTTSVEVYDLYLSARTLLRQQELGALRQARELLRRAVRRDPKYAPAWARLAEATMALSEQQTALGDEPLAASRAEALGYLRRALRIDPDLPEAHAAFGRVLPPGPEAERALRRAVELDPGGAESWLSLSERLFQSGRPEEGMRARQRAAAIEPLWLPAQEGLILRLNERDGPSATEPVAARFLAAADDPYVTHRVRALLAMEGSRLDQMIAHAEQARRLRPADRQVRTYEAYAFARLGLTDQALAVLPRTEAMSRLVIMGDREAVASEAVRRGAGLWSRKRDARMAGWILLSLGRDRDLLRLFDSRFRSVSDFAARAEEVAYGVPVLVAMRRTGRTREAAELRAVLVGRLETAARWRKVDDLHDAFQRAAIEAAMGDTAAALRWLERSVHAGYLNQWAPAFHDLADYPVFSPLRADPRFQRLRAEFIATALAQRGAVQRAGAPAAAS